VTVSCVVVVVVVSVGWARRVGFGILFGVVGEIWKATRTHFGGLIN
jgi:hypothetical protein